MKLHVIISMLCISALSLGQAAPDAGKPVGKIELMALVATGSSSERIATFIQHRGIDFTPDEVFLKSLEDDGAGASLLSALASAKVLGSNPTDAGEVEKETRVLEHLGRAARLNRKFLNPRAAEPEFRAAVAADPANPFVHTALGIVLPRLDQRDEAAAELRKALEMSPDLANAHLELGEIIMNDPTQRSKAEALAHLQKAADLMPYDASVQSVYASALFTAGGDKKEAEKQQLLSVTHVTPTRIRFGGSLMGARLIHNPAPKYPKEAKANHIQGIVRMDILIGKDGFVKDWEVLSGDPILTPAATEAISRWRYQPTVLTGTPVEVITEVNINFTLK
jgi:TonB family protein